MARLVKKYREEVVSAMTVKFGYKNPMAVPKLVKIVVSMGIGRAKEDIKILEQAQQELALITGQHPVITRAKKAVSAFKIREGDPVGCMVTLRRAQMYEFFDRLVNVVLPRVRDFRGLPANAFDEHGNYNLGLNEQTVFPEIDADKVTKIQGMNIAIVTSAHSREEAMELLKAMGMPFRQQ